MPLQKPHVRQLALTATAALGVWVFVKAGGPGAALPATGLAWLGWQSEAQKRRWLRTFRTRDGQLKSEARGAAAYFGVLAATATLAGGGWGACMAAMALCALSIAVVAWDAEGPAVLWGVPVLAWVGPALPATDRAFSVPSSSVDDWLPVIGLSAIYVPLAAILLWRGSRP